MASGEAVTSVDLNSTGAAFDAFAGNYPIVASNASGTGGFDVSNYDITYTNGVLTVNPFELTLSNFAASPKSYDGTTMVTGTGFLDNRIIPSDNISYSFDVAFVDANAAVNKLVNYTNIAITGGTHGVNYSLPVNSGTAYATISPKALTITPDNITKTYNTTYVFAGDEFTTSGVVNGEAIASVTLTSVGADASAAPGDYDIIASSAVAGASTSLDNYSITYAVGTLTVGSAGNMDLSAFVKYSKVGTDDLAMPGVTVQLLDGNNDVLYTSVTDQSGKYSFTNVPIADVAAIRADVNTALYCWAGVNATDAMVIQNHLVGNSPAYWQPVNFINHVADVTGNGTVTNSDPLALRYRVLYPDVPAYYFPSGDWAFSYNNTNMVNTGVATAELIAPVVNNQLADIAVRLFGDVNGSYVPCAGKRSADPVLTDDVLYVQQGVEFELPFRINNDAVLGAMTIMLDYNSELIELISLQSEIDGVYFSIDQNKLRVFWTNTNGLTLQADDNLFTLLAKTIAPVEAGMPLFFTDSQTEFADPDAVVINNLGLTTFAVDNVFVGIGDQLEQQILLTAYPNPFREKIEISYEIPMNAKVNLSILNMQGVMINELVDQTQFAGKHTMGVSATADHLTPGVYVVRLQIHMNGKVIEKYHRIVSVR
jgi:hypothetical protein